MYFFNLFVRWLIRTGRKQKALRVLQDGARRNKKTIPDDVIEKIKTNEQSDEGNSAKVMKTIFMCKDEIVILLS